MSVKAKPILENKFWIVEDSGQRIGTLTRDDENFVYSRKGSVTFYSDEKELKQNFGADFLTATITKEESTEQVVHGFPTRTQPYNSMYDITRKLPLFTKSAKSKSVYCAGYYLVKFNVNWLKSFCPKLITIERNQYMGPYKTELEMKAALSNVNRAN
jgi:hypothetical protein